MLTLSATLIAFCLAAAPTEAAAGEPWLDHVLSAEPAAMLKAAASRTVPEGTEVEILLSESHYEFDVEGRSHSTTRLVYRILAESAVSEWSVVRAAWSPWHQQRPVIKARIISADGEVHHLDPATLSEAPVGDSDVDVFSDRRKLHAPLPAVAVGSVCEEQITIREKNPLFAAATAGQFEFWSQAPARRMRLVLEAPTSVPLRYRVLGLELEPQRTLADGRVKLLFEMANVGPLGEIEPLMPSSRPRTPHVALSTGRNWGDVAQGYGQLCEPQLHWAELKPLAEEIAGGEMSRAGLAAKLLARVQSTIRYTSLDFGKSAIVPHSPNETLSRRYGDCKDQAVLLAGLLRAAGQPAHLALLRSGVLEDVPTDLPGLGFFNHAIVYVPGSPPMWIDPTVPNLPCGELPLADQGRLALVIAPGTKHLTRIPANTSVQNYTVERREFQLSEPGKTRVVRRSEVGGSMEYSMRSDLAQMSSAEIRKSWERFIDQTYRTKTITHFECTAPRDVDTPFRLRVEAADSSLGTIEETSAQVVIAPGAVLDRLPRLLLTPPEKKDSASGRTRLVHRRAPLALIEPYRHALTYVITPPRGYSAVDLPPGDTLRFGPAELSWAAIAEPDDTVVVRIKFDTGSGRFQPAEVDAARQALATVCKDNGSDGWTLTINFENKAQKLIEDKHFAEGLRAYRRLLEKYGYSAALEDRYAQALLAAGFGDAARLHARRAVQLAPKSASGWYTLAKVLTHDELGRHFHGNFDWQGAAHAYRTALELEPDDGILRWDYAILLEYDAAGRRYHLPARLSRAIEQYQRVRRKQPDLTGVNHALMLDLLYTGRFSELKEFVESQPRSSNNDSLRLVAVAAVDGAEKSRLLAREWFDSADKRTEELTGAAALLERARQYTAANKLLEASRAEKADPALEVQLRRARNVLNKLRPYESVLFPPSDPRRVAQEACLAVFMGGNWRLDVTKLLAKPLAQGGVYADGETMNAQLGSIPQANPRQTPRRLGDVLSLFTFESSGSDEAGYRVLAKGLGAKVYLYVIGSANHYRLWDSGPQHAEFGVAALAELKCGQADLARRHLRWAWEQLGEPLFVNDSYSGTPFGRLWVGSDQSNPEQLQTVAAALAAGSSQPQQAIEILRAARLASKNQYLKHQIDRALVIGLGVTGQLDELVAVADRMLAAYPDGIEPYRAKGSALVRLGRREEARAMAEKRYADHPGDFWARRLLGDLACERNDLPAVEVYLHDGIDRDPGGYFANTLAWNLVYCEPLPAVALAASERAIKSLEDPGAIHTLATIYAELGNTAEARAALLRCVTQRGEMDNIDWYVQGRIAEQDGCLDVARDAYRKVARPTDRWLTTTYELARRRLKVLGP